MKRYHKYELNFEHKSFPYCLGFLGMSLFLLAVYYLGFTNLRDLGFGEIFFGFMLPLLAGAGLIIIMKILKWNAAGIYAIAGAVLFVLLAIGTFFTGSAVRMILGILWYLACGAVFLATVGGYLPGKLPAQCMPGIAIFVRFFFFDLGKIGFTGFILEGAAICWLVFLMLFPVLLRPHLLKR